MAYIKKVDRKITAKVMSGYFIKQYAVKTIRYSAIMPNCYPTSKGTIYGLSWKESDLLAIRKSGYVEEIELKVDKNDYAKLEPLKTIHKGFQEVLKHDALQSGQCIPNYFSYLFPVGLVDYTTVPDKYGIYEFYYSNYSGHIKEVRKPKLLHRNKSEEILDVIKDKGYCRYINSLVKEKK